MFPGSPVRPVGKGDVHVLEAHGLLAIVIEGLSAAGRNNVLGMFRYVVKRDI